MGSLVSKYPLKKRHHLFANKKREKKRKQKRIEGGTAHRDVIVPVAGCGRTESSNATGDSDGASTINCLGSPHRCAARGDSFTESGIYMFTFICYSLGFL